MLKTRLLLSTFFVLSNAADAGLFGPSSFEECVLDGVKNAKTETAAGLVAQVCRNKFPDRTDLIPKEPITYNYGFSSLSAPRPAVNQIVNNIEVVQGTTEHYGKDYGYGIRDSWFRYYFAVTVTNRNNFPLSGITVGIPKRKNKNCSWDQNDYVEIYECAGLAAAQQTATFECNINNINKRRLNYCLVGFSIISTEENIKQFMKSKNIQPLK